MTARAQAESQAGAGLLDAIAGHPHFTCRRHLQQAMTGRGAESRHVLRRLGIGREQVEPPSPGAMPFSALRAFRTGIGHSMSRVSRNSRHRARLRQLVDGDGAGRMKSGADFYVALLYIMEILKT